MTAVIPVSTLTVSVGLLDQTFEELLTEDTLKYKSTIGTDENYQVTTTKNLYKFLECKGVFLCLAPFLV